MVHNEHPDADVEVWCEDEHRIGLQPVSRRIWVEEGEQPVAAVNWKREWLWLYGFVQPQTGETYWWILPYVNTKLFSRVLKDFAQHFGVSKNKHIINLANKNNANRQWGILVGVADLLNRLALFLKAALISYR